MKYGLEHYFDKLNVCYSATLKRSSRQYSQTSVLTKQSPFSMTIASCCLERIFTNGPVESTRVNA